MKPKDDEKEEKPEWAASVKKAIKVDNNGI